MSSEAVADVDTQREAVHGILDIARRSVADGVKAAARRLLVEVLRRSDNVGLREYRLPSLLRGDIGGTCAASWPLSDASSTPAPAIARDTGRGWRMDGTLPAACNLPGQWFLVSVPVLFEGTSEHALVLLDGEADGLHRRAAPLPGLGDVDRASLVLDRVFLREDEIITSHGTAFLQALAPFSMALRCAVLAGACSGIVRRWDDSRERDERLSTIDGLLQGAAKALDTERAAHEAAAALSALQWHARALAWWPLSATSRVGAEERVRLLSLAGL